jgi:hypothetical protein
MNFETIHVELLKYDYNYIRRFYLADCISLPFHGTSKYHVHILKQIFHGVISDVITLLAQK